jgi:hypothetical protein
MTVFPLSNHTLEAVDKQQWFSPAGMWTVTISSIGTASVIGNVITIPVSVNCTILGLTGKIIVPKLKKKAKKHQIKMNQSYITLNQINNLISRAITNEHISASEFELMMNEYQKVSEKA